MTVLSFVRAALVIVVLAILSGTHAIHAQADSDDTLEGMPKEQKEHYSKLLDLSKQYTQARETKNALAKKEALDKVTTETREVLSSINNMLSKDGAKDWIGEAGVVPGYLHISYTRRKDPSLTIQFSIPTKDLPKDVLDVAKKLAKGDQVRFSIASDEKNPAKMSGSKNHFTVQVPPQRLNSLTIVAAK